MSIVLSLICFDLRRALRYEVRRMSRPVGGHMKCGTVLQGHVEDSYMKNENWRISLTPNEVLPVTSHLVMEVGTFKSGGEGQYLLIWEKNPAGKWMVSLDFNF